MKRIQRPLVKGLLVCGLTGAFVPGSSLGSPPEEVTHCPTAVIRFLKKLAQETMVSRTDVPFWGANVVGVGGASGVPAQLFRSQIDSSLQLTAHPMPWKRFLDYAHEREQHGIWILFTPSSESDRFQTGHISIYIKGQIFTRSEGPGWDRLLQNLTPAELELGTDKWSRKTVLNFPYGLAQFLELPTPVVDKLSQFFSERVWNFYFGSGYSIEYNIRPHKGLDSIQEVVSENCTTFAFSYLYPRWQNQRQDLIHSGVPQAFGNFSINPTPTHQVFLNTTAAPYRESILISRDGHALDIQRVAKDLHAELQLQ